MNKENRNYYINDRKNIQENKTSYLSMSREAKLWCNCPRHMRPNNKGTRPDSLPDNVQ